MADKGFDNKTYWANRKNGIRGQGYYPNPIVGGMIVKSGGDERADPGAEVALAGSRFNPKKHQADRRKNRPINTVIQHGTVVTGSRIEATRRIINGS